MKIFIDKKIRTGFLLAFILLVISYFLLFSFTNKMLEHTRLANYSKEKIVKLETLFATLKNAGKNYQEYLVNGKGIYLNTIKDGKGKIDSSLKVIVASVNDSLENKDNEKLQILVNKVTNNYGMGLTEVSFSNNILSDTLKNILHNVSQATNLAQSQIKVMQNGCQDLFIKNDATANNCFLFLRISYFSSLFIAVVIAMVSMLTYFKENSARKKADEQSQILKSQLEQRIVQLDKSNKELEDLKSLEKFAATGRMARMIAHEVRNPLTNIGLANDQLKDAVEANEENLMLINMIKRNGERINQLVGDLLNATKFVELNLTAHPINDLLDDVILMAKDKAELKNILIIKNYSPEMCQVSVDADKIKIGLLNVLINSIESLKTAEGKIEVITAEINKMCVVTIRDNGIGMNKEVVAKLFEPFFSSKNKGNGLGLTNTQNIILNHKGNIVVESEVGKGTDFIIQLNTA